MNKKIIEFIFDFSGMEFTTKEWNRINSINEGHVTQEGIPWNPEQEEFLVKADKVEEFLNRLLILVELK